ncbi:thiamine pyrophosphokinase 1-like [Ciona intestinalis]
MEDTPLGFLNPNVKKDIVLVLLNQDWSSGLEKDLFQQRFDLLWKKACFKASVDGGTNKLHNVNETLSDQQKLIPDMISGDFDSVTTDLLEYYKNLGTEICPTPDQDYTDFTKCVAILGNKYKSGQIPKVMKLVVSLLGTTDRFDHCMANINTLYTARDSLPHDIITCLLFGDSYVRLLATGKSVLHVNTGYEGSWCSFTPLTGPAVVTTSGLTDNLFKACLRFDLVDKLRHELDGSGTLTVQTDCPIVFTLSILTT